MTLPPFRPSDQLSDVLGHLQAARSMTAVLQAENNGSPNRSVRFETTVAILESLCNAVSILAAMQRETQSDVADLHVKHYERELGAENQVLAYPSIYTSINEALQRADAAQDGYTAAQALLAALRFVVGSVDGLMVTMRHVRAKAAQVDTLITSVRTLREDLLALRRDLAPVIERERTIDNWIDDALKGQDDA